MKIAALTLAALVLAACTDSVSPPELGDYTSWHRVDTFGNVPGHGDSYRIIYVNDIARTRGTTERDAVLVKEVHDNDNGQPGALRIIEIMRKLRPGTAPDDEGGWLFTQMPSPGAGEVHLDLCWSRCHVQAPYAGAWFDYTK
ncbi:MAG: hypothetical protein IPQ07_22190 [Myxococcales bacterium]|nr:hypothetical protein [Myxococcales bacterium]